MALAKDDPAYISSERFAEAVKKHLLPSYLQKLRKEREEATEVESQSRIVTQVNVN